VLDDVSVTWRQCLSADLLGAMKNKDASAVSALRGLLSALDNASAVPIGTVSEPVVGRSGDVARRKLSAGDCRALLLSELSARAEAADEYARLGQADAAARLRAERAVIEGYVSFAEDLSGGDRGVARGSENKPDAG